MKFLAHLGFIAAVTMALVIEAIIESRTGWSFDFFVGWAACHFYDVIFDRRRP